MKKEGDTPYKTILVISTGFILVFLITHQAGFLYTSVAVALLALVSTFLANLIEKGWLKLGLLLSFIGPPVFLGLIFFVFLFPLSLIYKLFRKKDQLLLSGKDASTFIEVNRSYQKDQFDRPW